jgi:hypothetical protein
MFSVALRHAVLGLKPVVSITNVAPSQWPTELPFHCGSCGPGGALPSVRIIRGSPISPWMTT